MKNYLSLILGLALSFNAFADAAIFQGSTVKILKPTLRIPEDGSGGQVHNFSVPALGADITWTYPAAVCASGKVLGFSNGSGQLACVDALTNPMIAEGDMIGGGASGTPTVITGGLQGQVLRYDTAESTNHDWAYLGGDVVSITSANSPYSPDAKINTIFVDASGGAVEIIPVDASNSGKTLTVIKTDTSTNMVEIDPTDTICGQANVFLSGLNDKMVIVADGTNHQSTDCVRIADLRLTCNSGSSVSVDPYNIVSTIGNRASGTCNLTLRTGISSDSNWNCTTGTTSGNTRVFVGITPSTATAAVLIAEFDGGTFGDYTARAMCRIHR